MDINGPIINLKNISFTYPDRSPILDNLDFQFSKGDRLGLLGPNGSGKTTLFHIIMGLLEPNSGTLEIFGNPIRELNDFENIRQRIGLLFQDADDQLFNPTVLEDVAFGPLNLGKSVVEAKDIAQKTLRTLGLEGFEERIIYKLSGGEKRLVSLATVLAMEPEILLLDEPTTGLDDSTKEKLIDVLLNLDLSYIVISHEFDFLAQTTSSICAMEAGKIITDTKAKIHRHYHQHIHGSRPHKHESS